MCNPCKSKEPAKYVHRERTYIDRHDANMFVLHRLATSDMSLVGLHQQALLIRMFGEPAKQLILELRAQNRQQRMNIQWKWQHGVSRRPQRGNHHDSWQMREQYMRQTN